MTHFITLQRGDALRTKGEKEEYIFVNGASSACITHPDSYSQGGTMALWFKLPVEVSLAGVLSSCQYSTSTSCISISSYYYGPRNNDGNP